MHDGASRALYDRALSVLPGGVNSSVRALRPYPEFIDHGDGGHVVDVDGNRYVDHVLGYGPLLLGHTMPDPVREAVEAAMHDGPMYGAPTEVEVELAEFVVDHVPSVEMVRFVNSGTEATVSAVRLARGYTGRQKVVVMRGGYHGANDTTLAKGGLDGVEPGSAGIPPGVVEHTIPVPFNDVEAVEAVFEAHGDDVAAVLTEPLLGNTGIVEPAEGFHESLRRLCDDHGALLVLDEVITGFRVGGLGGAQSAYDIEPDLTTFGKVVGGGFPVGAIGGPAEIMESLTPVGDVFQSGTFSGHPVTMAAGLATLRYAADEGVYDHLADLGETLRSGLRDLVADRHPEYTVVGRDSLFKVIFTRERGVRSAADVQRAQRERWDRLFRPAMAERGVLLPPNMHEAQFLCAAHTAEDVETTLDAYRGAPTGPTDARSPAHRGGGVSVLHDVVDDPGSTTTEALVAAHADRLAAVVGAVGVAEAAEATGLPEATVEAVARGEVETIASLDLAEAAALLALEAGAPDADAIAAEARDDLLLGMTAGVLDVDTVAGEVALDIEPREVQGMLEGRHPMTLREYAAVHRVVASRAP